MAGQTVILHGASQRANAHRLVDLAPSGAILNIREATRSSAQNALMWALLSDIARAKPDGRVHSTDVWKSLALAMCGFPSTYEPSLDGNGVVPMGYKSSRLSKVQMTDLIDALRAYGDEHSVQWSDVL